MAVSAGLVLAVLYSPGYPLVVTAVALFGAVGQAYRPASASLLSELTPAGRQVMVFALYRLALNLGSTAAPLVGAALVSVSYNLLFWGEAAAALVYSVLAAVVLPGKRPAVAGRAAGTDVTVADDDGHTSYAAVLADRRFAVYLVAFFLFSLVYVQFLSALPLAVRDAGYGTALYSGCVALNGAVVICFELLVTRVVQRWPARVAASVGLMLLGVGLSMYALPLGILAFVLATVVWTFGETVGGPTMFAYPASAGPPQTRGRYLGAAHAMWGLGSALGPVAGVALWRSLGRPFWLVCGVVAAVAVAAAWTSMRAHPSASSPRADAATTGGQRSSRVTTFDYQ